MDYRERPAPGPILVVGDGEDRLRAELFRHIRRLSVTGREADEVMAMIAAELAPRPEMPDVSVALREFLSEVKDAKPRKGRYSNLYKKSWRKKE